MIANSIRSQLLITYCNGFEPFCRFFKNFGHPRGKYIVEIINNNFFCHNVKFRQPYFHFIHAYCKNKFYWIKRESPVQSTESFYSEYVCMKRGFPQNREPKVFNFLAILHSFLLYFISNIQNIIFNYLEFYIETSFKYFFPGKLMRQNFDLYFMVASTCWYLRSPFRSRKFSILFTWQLLWKDCNLQCRNSSCCLQVCLHLFVIVDCFKIRLLVMKYNIF